MAQQKLISNEYRCSSLSLPEIEAEVNEARGVGEDPLDILLRLEDEDGFVRDDDLDNIHTVGG